MTTQTTRPDELAATLAEADVAPRSPDMWALSNAVMEITATARHLEMSDKDESRDLDDLERILSHIVADNQAEDARHQKIIRLCRAAQVLCRRVAGERGQTGVQRRREPAVSVPALGQA